LREVFTLEAAKAPPDRASVLRSQGIPDDAAPREQVLRLVDHALEMYADLTEPRALSAAVSVADFETIYRGEGRNEHRTPLEEIFPRAGRLALFVVTLGDRLSLEIADLFERNEPALAWALDAIASERAERAAEMVGERFRGKDSTHVLPYSPGYCGWHVSGQRKLFEFLHPEEIDVTLNASCLMQPLKSVSGVLVAGAREIHDFDNDYDFCGTCRTHQCRERIASLDGVPAARDRSGGGG
jgi:hypothetical protein